MVSLDTLVAFCKRRGFVYLSSEIYGGFSAVYDYGSYGVELYRNISSHWWKAVVHDNEDVIGLNSAIFMHPKVWEASGHVSGFADPLVEHKPTNTRYRVDELLNEAGVDADDKMSVEQLEELFNLHFAKLSLPSNKREEYSGVRKFNLLVSSNLGSTAEEYQATAYLRGETCQGIYVNFKNVMQTTRVKIPFGIAQIGKAFRNEITPRQFIFRTREFEQMEMQYFVKPDAEMQYFDEWKQRRLDYYLNLGIKKENIRFQKHEKLAFYAKAAFDLEYRFPFGFKEIEGIHARGDYDLAQHQKFSGIDLTYTDPVTHEQYLPHVVETSTGVDRNFLMHLTEAFQEEETETGPRVVLKLPILLAPIKVAVFPLVANKPELVERAHKIFQVLKGQFRCEFDDNGNIGKRYRRQDEIGTPFCITVDYQTLADGTVTIRSRDSMQQERVADSSLTPYFQSKFI